MWTSRWDKVPANAFLRHGLNYLSLRLLLSKKSPQLLVSSHEIGPIVTMNDCWLSATRDQSAEGSDESLRRQVRDWFQVARLSGEADKNCYPSLVGGSLSSVPGLYLDWSTVIKPGGMECSMGLGPVGWKVTHDLSHCSSFPAGAGIASFDDLTSGHLPPNNPHLLPGGGKQ